VAARTPVSKVLRFEVFKRDNFTCQYCGRMAPDVVLEIDHIKPIAKSGKTTILNLVTSCYDCNRGKGAKKLTDNQMLKKQQDQLKMLNEKREQLKLMIKWQEGLSKFEDEQVDMISDVISNKCGYGLSEVGKCNFKKHIKKFGVNEVLESINISFTQYYKHGGKENEIDKAIAYVPRICYWRIKSKENPFFYKAQYIRGIVRNRFRVDDARLNTMLKKLVNDSESYDVICELAKTAKNWTCFWEEINELFEGDW
jgi:hypothetical protein